VAAAIVGSLIQFIVAGATIGAVYKSSSPANALKFEIHETFHHRVHLPAFIFHLPWGWFYNGVLLKDVFG